MAFLVSGRVRVKGRAGECVRIIHWEGSVWSVVLYGSGDRRFRTCVIWKPLQTPCYAGKLGQRVLVPPLRSLLAHIQAQPADCTPDARFLSHSCFDFHSSLACHVRTQALVAPYGPAYLSSPAGPFTIHPWPPASKLLISGTSLMELDRPTEKISFSQYSALTFTGAIFSLYGLAVTPINYPLTAVNVLLFASSAWHLGRKVKADYL